MRTLLLFRGAPGCGKSTYIKEHNLEQYVLSADTLRLMCQSAQETPAGQMEISPQNDDVVWEMLFKLLEVRMSHGEFTVIDATNSKTVEMNRYKNLAKQYRYRMYVIDMTDLPIEECKRRNAQREWLKRVPEAAIDMLTVAESWEKSMPDSYIQIFGHRNVQDVPIDMGHRCYNLEGKIEFGGYLRCIELEHGQPVKCVETKNDVFRKEEPKTETAVEMKTEFDNAELVSKMRQSKYVFEKRFGDISSFNFSREAFYKKHWDEVSTKARGLFINTKTNKIVARSYDKFFAVDERNETRIGNLQNTLKFPVTAYLKENGFLGIISYDAEQDGLFIASKSTPEGPFADMFRKILMDTTSDEDRKNLKEVAKENGSIIFEVIDPVNDAHIIEYKKPHIVLLDIVANDMNFSVMDYDDLKRVAEKCHLQIKEKVKTFENWSEFYPWYEEVMNENYLHHGFEHVEGFVLRDSNNFMFKMKLPYYKHWKFLRGVMQSVQKRGYYENTAKLFTAEDNLFYGWMREQREKDQESFCKKGIIQLRNEFYASQQKS